MSTLQVSNQAVQTATDKPRKYVRWFGFKDVTIKDVMQTFFALLIPAMIGILAVVLQKNEIDLTQKNRQNDLYIAQLQRDSDDEQTRVLANESIFTSYVKNIADILLDHSDRTDGLQYNITRVLTNTVLRQVSLEKKRLVIQFLYDTGILIRGEFVYLIDTRSEDIKNLRGADLNAVDFSNGLDLSSIVLQGVSLINASFADSHLEGADFSDSILNGVQFVGTRLDFVRFYDVQLQRTDFRDASLRDIQFVNVNLTQSTITDQQLAQALCIFNTILPNGTYARNKTWIINGDARQSINGWTIMSGSIEVKDFYFIGRNNSTMSQQMNTTIERIRSSYQSIRYCLSFLVFEQEYLIIEIIYRNFNQIILRTDQFLEIKSTSCQQQSAGTLNFCYWSLCKSAPAETDYVELKFTFGYLSNSTTLYVAMKNIEFTVIAQ